MSDYDNMMVILIQNESAKEVEKVKVLNDQIGRLQEEQKENELTMIAMRKEIEDLKLKTLNERDYKKWKHHEIFLWIISIEDKDGNKVFVKYENELKKELSSSALIGTDLETIDKSDLKDFGVTVYRDRQLLFQRIKQLINANNNDKKQNMNDNNFNENEGGNAPTAYI